MVYFKINDTDYSMYTAELKITNASKYTTQTNAHQDTVVDYINDKKTIEVEIIPLNDTVMSQLTADISGLGMNISYLNPQTKQLKTISCILPSTNVEYYTIQQGKVSFKKLKFFFLIRVFTGIPEMTKIQRARKHFRN